jgi:hypothetical protein
MLKGKCKEAFEKWILKIYEKEWIHSEDIENGYEFYGLNWFNRFTLSMQYGVYVDFFLSLKIDVIQLFYDYYRKEDFTVKMSRDKAIEKAMEIFNNKN